MNYCDYYLKVLSIYISTRAMSPLDLFYSPRDRELYIWNPGADDRNVVLYPQSGSWKVHPPVESVISYKFVKLNLNFGLIYESKKTPQGYITQVML